MTSADVARPGEAPGAGGASSDVAVADDFSELHGFCDGVAPVSPGERAERIARARASMRASKFDALVMEAGAAMQYFGGVRWGRSERPMQLVLRADDDDDAMTWVGPAFEAGTLRERLETGGAGGRTDVVVWQEHESPYAKAAEGLRAGARVAFDAEVRRFITDGWRSDVAGVEIADGKDVVDRCRAIKSPQELTRLRRANEATKAALAAVAPRVEPGMSEHEVAALARSAQLAAGLSDVWVLALADASAAFPHGARTDARVREGRLVLIDTGGFLHDYASDITRTFGVGEIVDPDLRRAYDAVLAAQSAALDAIRPGRACGDADAAARAVLAEAGFGGDYENFTHRLGHGIGLQVHEVPYLRRANPRVLEPGMTMSNEPGIYVPGEYGIRIEDIVAVTDGAPDVFGPRAGPLGAVFG